MLLLFAAVGHLNAIVSADGKQPAVLLFLADLYERNLGDRQKAIESLEVLREQQR